ncbi:MAG: L-aspartate oxidase [Alphaproteobacteria bacterium]|nr:L-aspartate oxidase [Alphaproteobacteria bacterium]
MTDTHLPDTDDSVLVIGAGLAGLFLALELAPRRVIVLSPTPLGSGAASAWAQGGIAAALAADDDPELHAADTVAAGAGLVDPVVARLIAEDGPGRVRDLLALGVPFDRSEDGSLRLSLEAAHSRPRVARVAGDLAGKAIMDALAAAVRSAAHVRVVEGLRALALLRDDTGAAAGALCRDRDGRLVSLAAAETVLATGGVGGLWRVTTNPASALGHGLAMAAQLGALIGDPEFVQFHPTAIDVGRDPAPLATEALRGEGAALVDATGAPFMARYHPRGDLAPRDVVARAIARQIAAGAGAFLDCRAAVGAAFPEHFPTVFAACQQAGLDPRTAPIPVAPAAHYHMGGVVTDLWARTTVPGLSAIGECASTGAHGANRLASNSLLESVVFAKRCAERLREDPGRAPAAGRAGAPPDLPAEARAALRALMQRHCGVERDAQDRAAARDGVHALVARHGLASDLVAAAFVVEGAARRLESRGGHWAPDHPNAEDPPRRTFLTLRQLELPS